TLANHDDQRHALRRYYAARTAQAHCPYPKLGCPGTKLAARLCRMTPSRVNEGSLRPGRLEISGLAIALALSLLFHGGVWGGYKLAKGLGWLQMIHVPAWLQKTKMFSRTDPKKDPDPQM